MSIKVNRQFRYSKKSDTLRMPFQRIELSWSYIASSLHLLAKLCKPVKTFSLVEQLICITNGTFGLKIRMITFYKLTLIIMSLIRIPYLSHNLSPSRLKDLSQYKLLHIKLRSKFNKSKATSIIPKLLKHPKNVPRSPLSKNTKDKILIHS